MINFDNVIGENIIIRKLNCLYISYHSYRISIIGGTRSQKANVLFIVTYNQEKDDNIDKVYL